MAQSCTRHGLQVVIFVLEQLVFASLVVAAKMEMLVNVAKACCTSGGPGCCAPYGACLWKIQSLLRSIVFRFLRSNGRIDASGKKTRVLSETAS